jgi:hypothetical protein
MDDQPCFSCQTLTKFLCISCQRSYCPACASRLDPTYCKECGSAEIKNEPLVDDEGVVKKGRHILLSGEAWMRSRDVISKMTDVELEAKLTALKEAVHEAELILDYRRIIYAQAQNEKEARGHKRIARLRERGKMLRSMDAVKQRVASKSPKGDKLGAEGAADAMSALKKMGLNKEMIAQLLFKLAQGGTK